ncbi:TetR/AcrR family transcriptional regulator [Paenibacillus jilunlii]|uniref:TetR family transcriptional regulator n=1 Tax=Paenibacillus jilunlii TaxID=682956 RepID=A0A1G9TLQ9_9BACL|nr:TetR/AcrR family transcriptional regulator [Paenibacillus jilunlii]KWX71965.1 TetR family transcriptional regulator [Paenibacillus jilunlii]SDM48055.1 transcriptional regulator, TetR family [Paenibacillus jilunlii]
MGRKQAFTKSELLDQTKKVLIEHGYEGFHLKLLSGNLVGARSTIYQYYANKEEIVAACMKRAMENVLQKASAIDETDCMEALQQLLTVYLEEADFHQLLGDAHKINKANSSAAANDIEFVDQAHTTLKKQLERLFVLAQQEGHLNTSIPLPVVIGVFFNLIDTPNMMNIPTPQWSRLLFQMWLGGAGRR